MDVGGCGGFFPSVVPLPLRSLDGEVLVEVWIYGITACASFE
jgi:hypothetical protein